MSQPQPFSPSVFPPSPVRPRPVLNHHERFALHHIALARGQWEPAPTQHVQGLLVAGFVRVVAGTRDDRVMGRLKRWESWCLITSAGREHDAATWGRS